MNLFDPQTLTSLTLAAAGLLAVKATMRRFYVSAQPDEWLLCLRDGVLVHAGVGVAMIRRPGDVVVRFSSTMQRVGFAVDVLSLERLSVRIEGFIFWSVSPEGDSPFVAYSKLGIANLRHPPPGLRHPRHLLTSAQHKAFQQILTAVVQRHASSLSLDALIGQQDALVLGLTSRLRAVTSEMGVRVNQVEILTARPSEATVQSQLAAVETERLREESARVRREVAERIARAENDVAVRAQELARARELTEEARALEASRARMAREREELDAKLAQVRSEAEAARDAEMARAEVLERMSPAVREHSRSIYVAEKVAATLKVTDARWVSVGAQSPAASVSAMIAGVRELLDATTRS